MRVISFCKISGHSIVLDGERQPDLEGHLQGQMLSEKFDNLFKVMHGDYPRFYRLDDYSKLGIIAAELILRKAGLDTVTPKPDLGIILHTRSGTLYADSMYAQTIQDILDFNPDPELFARIHSNAVCSILLFGTILPANRLSFFRTDSITKCFTGWEPMYLPRTPM